MSKITTILAVAGVPLLTAGFITWLWTRTTYRCAGWVQVVDVTDIGDRNFKATYSDGSYGYFDDFYQVELEQLKCTGEEVAPPKDKL